MPKEIKQQRKELKSCLLLWLEKIGGWKRGSQHILYSKKNKSYFNKILSSTDYLPISTKITERLYHILNDLYFIPKCIICGDSTKFYTFKYSRESRRL